MGLHLQIIQILEGLCNVLLHNYYYSGGAGWLKAWSTVRISSQTDEALKRLRNILFILQQSGVCFFELMTCAIQGVLQVFGCIGFL